RLGEPLHRRLTEANACQFLERALGGLAKTLLNACQSSDFTNAERVALPCQRQLLVPGKVTLTAMLAVVIGAFEAHIVQQDHEGLGTIALELRGLLAAWAGHARALVALFFRSSRAVSRTCAPRR